jgi:hypothetical protein
MVNSEVISNKTGGIDIQWNIHVIVSIVNYWIINY